jgi:hypothetical protein
MPSELGWLIPYLDEVVLAFPGLRVSPDTSATPGPTRLLR